MLAIGFLSLLSLGFVAMSMGGEDDLDTSVEDQDEELILRPDEPMPDPVSEEETPSDETPDDRDPVAEEEAADDPLAPPTADDVPEEEANTVVRPPMGEQYRDPLKLLPEWQDQGGGGGLPEEAEDLVTVTDSDGEVPDEEILSENSEGLQIVTAPEGPNTIEVEYDETQRFQINYSAGTSKITAGLNSILEGPEGAVQQNRYITLDEEGEMVTALVWGYEFSGSTAISLDVDPDQIGTHVAQVSLVNQVDTLRFDIDPAVEGNFHLFLYEEEIDVEGVTSAMMRAFVVQTATTQTALSAAEIEAIARDGVDTSGSYSVLAEIFLGNDSVFVSNPQDGAAEYDIWVNDFINSDPKITANVGWSSVTQHTDDGAPVRP